VDESKKEESFRRAQRERSWESIKDYLLISDCPEPVEGILLLTGLRWIPRGRKNEFRRTYRVYLLNTDPFDAITLE
jgi:hypothetical protein